MIKILKLHFTIYIRIKINFTTQLKNNTILWHQVFLRF